MINEHYEYIAKLYYDEILDELEFSDLTKRIKKREKTDSFVKDIKKLKKKNMEDDIAKAMKKINTEINRACYNGDSKTEIILEYSDLTVLKEIFSEQGYNATIRGNVLEVSW